MDYKIIDYTEELEKSFIYLKVNSGASVFEVNNSNPDYISFLRQLSEENPNDPHYLAWVEAGNTPEDFWTQDDELEPTEPKEEEETPQEGEV